MIMRYFGKRANITTNITALMVEIHPTSLERIQPKSAIAMLNAIRSADVHN
jgi:hypothetical protein